MAEVSRALAPATWSSRFTTPFFWADPNSGIAYQVQVETPQSGISSVEDMAGLPVKSNHVSPTLLRDVASVVEGSAYGEYHRLNMHRLITVNANVAGADLGTAASIISQALSTLPDPPQGISVTVRGQLAPMSLMVTNLELGLILSVIAVFLLLAPIAIMAPMNDWMFKVVPVSNKARQTPARTAGSAMMMAKAMRSD